MDYQSIEDRFWVWVHYASSKLGRGELFEAIDALSLLRNKVLGSLLHLKYKSNPRGVRKLEFILDEDDRNKLKKTIPLYTFDSIKSSVRQVVEMHRELRELLFNEKINRLEKAEQASISYLNNIRNFK